MSEIKDGSFLAHRTSGVSSHSTREKNPHSLSLTVLFTSVPATLHALRKAAQLAHELHASIRILVPQVVPYPLPLDEPRVAPEFRLRHFRTLCEHEPIETHLDIRLCRDAHRCIHAALLPNSLIVVGSTNRWPFSRQKRLARSLTKAGHEVLWVPRSALGNANATR